jgi:hypothetical protein
VSHFKDDIPRTRCMSVFSAPARYRVVKIVCSSSKVVLQIMKHTVIYPGSGLSLEVIALRPAGLILKMNKCYKE